MFIPTIVAKPIIGWMRMLLSFLYSFLSYMCTLKNLHLPNDPILKKISGTLSRFNAAKKKKNVKNISGMLLR